MTPEEYAKKHKTAFRVAFDFLNAHFPPGPDPEWWEHAAKDLSEAGTLNCDNELAMELLVGVYNYIETEWKRRNADANH